MKKLAISSHRRLLLEYDSSQSFVLLVEGSGCPRISYCRQDGMGTSYDGQVRFIMACQSSEDGKRSTVY